ncbi:10103_t:CDS:2, partial [Racocetra fulgida]
LDKVSSEENKILKRQLPRRKSAELSIPSPETRLRAQMTVHISFYKEFEEEISNLIEKLFNEVFFVCEIVAGSSLILCANYNLNIKKYNSKKTTYHLMQSDSRSLNETNSSHTTSPHNAIIGKTKAYENQKMALKEGSQVLLEGNSRD